MLEGLNLTKRFGALTALNNVCFKINSKEIVGLIGPNGSGKTTLFNVLSGYYKPDAGRVKFMGHDITGLPPHKICRMGLARTFQIPRPFLDMSVLENVIVSALYGANKSLSEGRDEALAAICFVGLEKKKDVLARHLNVCERKFLEIARCLATKPKILLIDEPLSGLNPKEIIHAKELIRRIRDDLGITVFWIEHIIRALSGVVDRVMVLNQGEKIADGRFEEVTMNQMVIEAYLGERWLL